MKPLVVDLDNTLLRTDLLAELLPSYLLRNPGEFPKAIAWLLSGRARLKDEIAKRCPIDPATLPYNETLLEWLREERARGREIWLVSASHEDQVAAISGYLGLFAGCLGSNASRNLKGERKREALVERFGARGFDYAGDSRADLAVWRDAAAAIVVGDDETLVRRAARVTTVVRRFETPAGGLGGWRRALRVNQWLKNALVFVPLLTAQRWDDPVAVATALLGFIAFSFAASSIYLLNDLADIADDRSHPVKRHRPLASGLLPVPQALGAAALLALLAMAIALLLPSGFAGWLAVYLITTTAYSAALKRRPVVDVVCLAGLYTLRLLAGAAAIGVEASFWLLAFSMFVFLSLALIKRFAELRRHALDGGGRIARNYDTDDLPVIVAAGTGAGLAAVLVLALYIQSGQTLAMYAHPARLWVACPLLLYWVLRAWFLANRGEIDEDPLAWTVRDRSSWLVALAMAIAFFTAL